MDNSDDKESKLSTSTIAAIAYSESKKMAGGNKNENSPTDKEEMNFKCVDKIKNFSVIVGMTEGISEAYNSLKKSNDSIGSILNTTEEQLNEGIKILSPVTNKIGGILEEPLKNIDDAIYNGFDYLGEKIPQLKNESEQIYTNIEEYIKTSLLTKNNDKVKNDETDKSNDTKKIKED